MKKFNLLEALNQYQRDEVLPSIMDDAYYHEGVHYTEHDKVFAKYNDGNKNADRIILPTDLNPVITQLPNKEVLEHLAKHGWTVHDYVKGTAIRQSNAKKADGSPKTEEKSIGSILKDTGADTIASNSIVRERVKTSPHPLNPSKREPVTDEHGRPVIEKYSPTINQLYETDPVRSATKNKSGFQIVISRNPEDVVGMSTNRSWSSCMRLPDSPNKEGGCNYAKFLPADLAHQTLTAYLTRKGDDNIESPISRITLKRLINNSDSYNHTYRPHGDIYGEHVNGFKEEVNKFAIENFKANNNDRYYLAKGLYDDNDIGKLPRNLQDNTETETPSIREQATRHHIGSIRAIVSHKINSEGLLHTDNDEPSIIFKDHSGADVSMWHRNGELHRENGPAYHALNDQSDNPHEKFTKRHEVTAYYMHGLLHSPKEGGIPSYSVYNEQKSGSKFITKAFHKFGVKHNDPIHKISSIDHSEYSDGEVRTITAKHIYGREYEHTFLNKADDSTKTIRTIVPQVPSKKYGLEEEFPIPNFVTAIAHVKDDNTGKTSVYDVKYAPGCETNSHTFIREKPEDEFGTGTIVKNTMPKHSEGVNTTKNTITYRSREPLFVNTSSQDDLNYILPDKTKQFELFKK